MICKVCKGSGKQTLTVREYDKPEQVMRIPCVWCHGSGEMTEKDAKALDFEKKMWCKCKPESDPRGWIFKDDGKCRLLNCMVFKHHYHCPVCDKITQVG